MQGIVPLSPLLGGLLPPILAMEDKASSMFLRKERAYNQHMGVPNAVAIISLLPHICAVFRFDGFGLKGGRPQEGDYTAPAIDNTVTDLVYNIHILPHSFPGTFHPLPCYRRPRIQGLGGVLRHNSYMYVN